MNDFASSAVVLYGVVIAYLAVTGVRARRIGFIVVLGLLTGLLLSFSLGLVYYLVVLQRPVETISVFSMAGIVLATAYVARDEILAHTTPLGIVLLNLTANLLPASGPLPLSLAGLAALVPIPYGPVRIALNLAVLYWPALLALLVLHRGPPGNPWLRYLLGTWLCWIGIAAASGPGWSALSRVRLDQPLSWLGGGVGALAGMHLLMMALNLFASLTGKDEDSARSVARSIRVDAMRPSHAAAWGAGFALALWMLRRAAFDDDLKMIAGIVAAFFLASQLRVAPPAANAAPEEGERRWPSLSTAGVLFLVLGLFGTFAFWMWRDTHPGSRATDMHVSAATGMAVETQPMPGMLLRYEEPELQAMLKDSLAKEGAPYTTQIAKGKEYLKIEDKDRPAAKRAIDAVEGPPLPPYGAVLFRDDVEGRAFAEWLTARGVGWRMVRKRLDHYLVWDDGPRRNFLLRAFDDEQPMRFVGVDYYALYVLAGVDPVKLAEARTAAFASPAQQKAFIDWLRTVGARPAIESREGREFVVWEGGEPDLLSEYKRTMRARCLEDYRQRARDAPPGTLRNPC